MQKHAGQCTTTNCRNCWGTLKGKCWRWGNAIKPTFPHPVTTLQFYLHLDIKSSSEILQPTHQKHSKNSNQSMKMKTAGKSISKNDFNQTVLPFSRVLTPPKKKYIYIYIYIYKPLQQAEFPHSALKVAKSGLKPVRMCLPEVRTLSSMHPKYYLHSRIRSISKWWDCLFDCNSTWCSINLTRITRTEDDARPFIQDKQMRPD